MKKLVVFYSFEGNTRLVARTVAEVSGADVLELSPLKERTPKGASRYFWGGRAALMGDAPVLKPYAFEPDRYDILFVGTPVWAWTFAPPLNTFFRNNDLRGRNTALFCCHGGGPGRIFQKMRSAIPEAVILGELALREPLKHDTESQLNRVREWAGELSAGIQTRS